MRLFHGKFSHSNRTISIFTNACNIDESKIPLQIMKPVFKTVAAMVGKAHWSNAEFGQYSEKNHIRCKMDTIVY